jgi:hypothetical protein
MKHPMSLEATLDQLVSDFVRALLEAALKTTPSDFAAALGQDSEVRSPALSPPAQEPSRVQRRRTPPPSTASARSNRASSREPPDPSSPGSPAHVEEASPAHAITDPALLLRAIDDASASPEPPVLQVPQMPSRATRAAPSLLETTVAEASTGSTLRAGEEILRKTGGGMVFRRTSPRRS